MISVERVIKLVPVLKNPPDNAGDGGDAGLIFGSNGVICVFPFLSSLVAQMVKNLPAMQETRVQSLGQEDPLEEGMATHTSILAQRIPWTEEPSYLQSMGSQRVVHD